MRIQSELHATNSAIFKKSVYKLTGIKPAKYILIKNKLNEYSKTRNEDRTLPAYARVIVLNKNIRKNFIDKIFKNLVFAEVFQNKVFRSIGQNIF